MGAGISNFRSTKQFVVEDCKFPPLRATQLNCISNFVET